MLISNLIVAESKYINLSHAESLKSPVCMKHGCVAVINGRVVASGYNHYRTYSSDGYIKNSCTCHAEMDTLRELNKRSLSGKRKVNNKKIILYIVRTDHNGEFKESGPCVDCFEIIKKLNIKKIIFSCDNHSVIISKPRDYMPEHVSLGRRYINRQIKI